MREIKFRAQETNSTNWVYGHYYTDQKFINGENLVDVHTIRDENHQDFEVKGETVGQFTGLLDKNRKEIYEGDNVRILYADWASKSSDDERTLDQYKKDISRIGVVVFDEDRWRVSFYYDKYTQYHVGSIFCGAHGEIEIIGNIHQDKNLLK